MTSPFEQASESTPEKARTALLAFADQLRADGHDPSRDRLEVLQQLLGAPLCQHLGLYRLPEGFVLSVVVPVFNEVKTIDRIIERIRNTELPLEIILVDDGSTDGSRQRLQEMTANDPGLQLILHDRNKGKGAALKSGFAAARGDVIVVQDADMEYDPYDFHALLQPIIEDRADVVYGSRFSTIDCPVSPLWHRWANQFITLLTGLALGRKFTDVETCYKMFRCEVIKQIAPTLQEKRFGIEIEMTCKLARKRGVRIYERPIRYDRRSYAEGKKISWRDGVAAMWCILRYSFGRSR